jgi:DNA-binding XRE family transcriptional regulator
MAKAKVAPVRKKKLGRVAQDILDGLDELRRHLRGEKTGIKVYPAELPPAAQALNDLKAARDEAGMTTADVAAASGLSVATVTRLEKGRVKNPTVDVLERYAKAVGRELHLSVTPAK